jgi:hypothetical protein
MISSRLPARPLRQLALCSSTHAADLDPSALTSVAMLGPTYCLTAPSVLLVYSTRIRALEKRIADRSTGLFLQQPFRVKGISDTATKLVHSSYPRAPSPKKGRGILFAHDSYERSRSHVSNLRPP